MALKPLYSMRIEGLKELELALAELPKATAKNVLRRVAIKALTPFIEMAKQLVPIGDTGNLYESLAVSTRLSKRQRKLANRERKHYFEIYAGASALPHAHLVEFGTSSQKAQPYMRPAWDSHKHDALEIIKDELGKEILAAARRLARKNAANVRLLSRSLGLGRR